MKKFNVTYNVGHAKYVVNSHDGVKTHSDGSEFFDIEIFKSKKALNDCIFKLLKNGYRQV